MDIHILEVRFEAATPDDAYMQVVETIQADGLEVQWLGTVEETSRKRPDLSIEESQ